MFSPDIVSSDAFVDMPMSAQALYFHLCLNADDDGFIGRPKQICRMVGANDDDLKILFAKRFLLAFKSGVAVIKHWLVHNLIRADLYNETTYKQEKNTLGLNEFGAYTELRPGVSPLRRIEEPQWLKRRRSSNDSKGLKPQTEHNSTNSVPQTVHNRHVGKERLGKERKGNIDTKVSIGGATAKAAPVDAKKVNEMFEYWNKTVGTNIRQTKTGVDYAKKLYREYEMDGVRKLIDGAALAVEDQYAPRISNFNDLYLKKDRLMLWGKKRMSGGGDKPRVAVIS